MEGNQINCDFCGNQKKVKMRRPFNPSVFMEHKNGKTHREKLEGNKYHDLIDSREAKKASEDGR